MFRDEKPSGDDAEEEGQHQDEEGAAEAGWRA
jgi:hypothetical protein